MAKSLEIKELCNTETETNYESEVEPSPGDATETLDEQTVMCDDLIMEAPQERQRRVVSVEGKYKCDQCDYQTTRRCNLNEHIQIKHEGIKYACDQCGSKFARQGDLVKHIQARHEGGGYACTQCDYVAARKQELTRHTLRKHA